MIFCERKNCKYNQWGVVYGYHCKERVLKITNKGSCKNYIRLTAEEMKEKRQRYPYKGVY